MRAHRRVWKCVGACGPRKRAPGLLNGFWRAHISGGRRDPLDPVVVENAARRAHKTRGLSYNACRTSTEHVTVIGFTKKHATPVP